MNNDRKKKGRKPDTAAVAVDRVFDRDYNVVLNFIVGLSGLLYVLLNPRYGTGFLNDDAVYVITAHDFWKTALSHPLLGIKPDYPLPGLPMVLAPFAHLFAPHWGLLEWLSILVTTASVLLMGRWVTRFITGGEALAAVGLYAFNRIVVHASGTIMPSVYYAAAVVTAFILMRAVTEALSKGKALALGVVVGWGCLLRPEGAALLVGVSAGLLASKQGRRQIILAAIPVAACGIFLLAWFHSRRTVHSEFGSDLTALRAYWLQNWTALPLTCLHFIRVLFWESWPSLQYLPTGLATVISHVAVLLSLICVPAGFASIWKSRKEGRPELLAIGVFCGLYFSVHVLWHAAEPRYYLPLLPFAAVFLIRGGSRCLALIGGSSKAAVSLLLVLFLPLVYQNSVATYKSLFAPEPSNSPPWRSLAWLEDNTDASARVTSNIAPSVDLYTGRNALGVLTVDNGDEFLYLLVRQEIDYVVFRDLQSITTGVEGAQDTNIAFDLYRRWIRFYPERFPVANFDEREQTGIYRVVAPQNFVQGYETYIEASRLANAGNLTGALQRVNECVVICPSLGCAYNLRGALFLMGKNFDDSEKSFLRAAELLPDSSSVLLNLANLAHLRGRSAEQLTYLKRAKDVGDASGGRKEFEANYRNLQHLWIQGRSTLFFKAPHTDLYPQMIANRLSASSTITQGR